MKRLRNLFRRSSGFRNVLFTIVAGIPIFVLVVAYLNAMRIRGEEPTAFFITLYFLGCVFIGRFVSKLWIDKDNRVPQSRLWIWTAVNLISTIVVFLLAQLSIKISLNFIRILFVGLPFTVLGISLGVLINLVRESIRGQIQEAKAEAAQSQGELRFLQNQLSPHFLFNTLNNIYGISLTQHERIPNLLLKLADLLRYSVYEAKETFVPVKNEVAYLKDYIEFEKLRIGDKIDLHVSFEEVDGDRKIVPLLLIVFVENAFKHAKNTTEERIFISIELKTWGNSILFGVKNSANEYVEETGILKRTDSGFGLESVQKRLELLYEKSHHLEIEQKNGFYTVMLQLKAR